MSEEVDLSWRLPALIRFDELMHADGEAINELRRAGVSERRISVLYPFDIENYRDATVRLFSRNNNRAHSEAGTLSMFSIYGQVATRLPERFSRQAAELHNRPHTSWTRNALTIRRALYANLFMLPLTLQMLEGYPYPEEGEESSWTWSHETVRLKADLPKFKVTAEGWLAMIERELT